MPDNAEFKVRAQLKQESLEIKGYENRAEKAKERPEKESRRKTYTDLDIHAQYICIVLGSY